MNNIKSYFWGLLARFAPQGIYLVTTMILARFITPEDFGMIGVLAVIFTVANILLDSGLGGSLIKEKEITGLDCSTIGTFNIIVGILIYIILFLLSNTLEAYFEIPGLSHVVRVISIVFPITALGIVPQSLLKRNLEFKKLFISSIISVIIASLVAIIIAVKGGGVYALVSYQIMVNLVLVICNFIFTRYRLSFRMSLINLERLFPFGFFTSIVTIVDTVYENIMTMLTGKFLNVQTAGYLYQAKRLEETMSSSLAMAVGIVAFPVLTRMKDNLEEFVTEAQSTLKTITLLVFPILITVSIYSKEILVILFGKQWISSAPYLRVLMISGLFILMEQLYLSFIKALGRVKSLAYITLAKRVVGLAILLAALAISPDLLVYAYLVSTIIGFVVNLSLFCYLTNKAISTYLKELTITITPMIVYCFLAYSIMNLISLKATILTSLVFLSFYYLFFLKFRGVDILNFLKLIFNRNSK